MSSILCNTYRIAETARDRESADGMASEIMSLSAAIPLYVCDSNSISLVNSRCDVGLSDSTSAMRTRNASSGTRPNTARSRFWKRGSTVGVCVAATRTEESDADGGRETDEPPTSSPPLEDPRRPDGGSRSLPLHRPLPLPLGLPPRPRLFSMIGSGSPFADAEDAAAAETVTTPVGSGACAGGNSDDAPERIGSCGGDRGRVGTSGGGCC